MSSPGAQKQLRHPVDSKNMISTDDHGWDEQDQYEPDKDKARLVQLTKNPDFLDKEERLDIIHDQLEQQLEGQRKLGPLYFWDTEEGRLDFIREFELLHRECLQQDLPRHMEVDHFLRFFVAKFSGADDTNNSNVLAHILRHRFCRKFSLSPKDDNQEACYKQMMSPYSKNFDGHTSGCLKKSVEPKSMVSGSSVLKTDRLMKLLSQIGKYLLKSGILDKYIFGQRIRTSRKGPDSTNPFNTSTNKKTTGSITDKGFVIHSAYAKGNRVRKNISVISRAGNGGSSSEGTICTLTGGNNRQRETILSYNDMPKVTILDNQAQVNCTGVFNVLSNLSIGTENIVLIAANGAEMETFICGSVHLGNIELPNVHYCPDLLDILIVSGSMLDNDDYGYEFLVAK